MSERRSTVILRNLAFFLFLFILPGFIPKFSQNLLHAETPADSGTAVIAAGSVSAAAKKVLETALAKTGIDTVIAELSAKAATAASAADRKFLLASLADYAERCGRAASAAVYFHDAAFADPAARDDSLLLDSARCLLASGDIDGADSIVRAVTLTSFDDPTLNRARAYAAWITLYQGDRPSALTAIRALAGNPRFEAWGPSLNFTLWWTEGDQTARAAVLTNWPKSPEAAVLLGKISLSPVSFWYLMPRNEAKVAAFAAAGQAPAVATASSAPNADSSAKDTTPLAGSVGSADTDTSAAASGKSWQQTGFFKFREYAEDLSAALLKAGFQSEIREEKRPSGTVYFAVLVPENAEGTTGLRLKNAGFESYLVTD